MTIDPCTNPSTLTEVANEFNHWRAQRTTRSSTPARLRDMAAGLLDQHSSSEICRALAINGGAFRQWAIERRGVSAVAPARKRRKRAESKLSTDFVELAPVPVEPLFAAPSSAPLSAMDSPSDLVVDLPDGTRITARNARCAEQLLSHLCQAHLPGAVS